MLGRGADEQDQRNLHSPSAQHGGRGKPPTPLLKYPQMWMERFRKPHQFGERGLPRFVMLLGQHPSPLTGLQLPFPCLCPSRHHAAPLPILIHEQAQDAYIDSPMASCSVRGTLQRRYHCPPLFACGTAPHGPQSSRGHPPSTCKALCVSIHLGKKMLLFASY